MKKFTLFFSALLFSMMSFAGVVTFDADNDKGNAGTDSNNAAAYTITKSGVTVEVSSGILGTYNNETHYRVYKNQTLTITSTVGNITSVEFTCTANDDAQYGPGCFTVVGGEYTYSGPVGTWTGSASTITFTATTNQVRATQVVVTVDGEVIPDDNGGNNGGDNGGDNGGTTPVDPGKTTIEIPAEAASWNIPAEAIDVLQARAICAGLESGATTGTKYYVMGYVKKIHNKHADGIANYGNAQFYMENVKGANSQDDFMAYQVYGLNGQKIADPNAVAVGDFVVIYGELTNYMGNTYETVGKGAAYIWNSTNALLSDPNVVNIEGLQYADAWYNMNDEVAQYDFILYNDYDNEETSYVYPKLDLTVAATAKTAINGTYSLLSATYWASATESVEMGSVAGTVAVKNVKGIDYSFTGSFVGVDGKTYKFNKTVEVTAYDEDDEEIVLKEEATDNPGTETPAGAIVFDADVDKGNAGTDSNNAAEYVVTKNGVTMTVSSGILGTYNNEMHYRIYKNQTLTLTSTAGNIVKVEFTCTANDDAKYGPGCFTVVGGEYTYSGPVGTWTGNAPVITFTATSNQVRATQVVVTLEGSTGVENILASDVPEKVLMDGQIYIVRGENVYTILGAQVK